MTEKEFQRAVLQRARDLGWKTAHFGNTVRIVRRRDGSTATIPDRDAAGFPDLVLVRTKDKRLVFAELKARTGRMTDAQYEWLNELKAVGAEIYLWREHHDWPLNIERVLR